MQILGKDFSSLALVSSGQGVASCSASMRATPGNTWTGVRLNSYQRTDWWVHISVESAIRRESLTLRRGSGKGC